jgi:uncharacterized protein YaeQ
MALGATVHAIDLELSDVDRGVYETLELRVAQHPSETMRYLLTRTLAYALSFEEGIAFSKGGLSQTDEPPVAIWSPDGRMRRWIDVGVPSAERLHKASKLTGDVELFTSADLEQVRRAAQARPIHAVERIGVLHLDPGFLDGIEAALSRRTTMVLVRSDQQLYVDVGPRHFEAPCVRAPLLG